MKLRSIAILVIASMGTPAGPARGEPTPEEAKQQANRSTALENLVSTTRVQTQCHLHAYAAHHNTRT